MKLKEISYIFSGYITRGKIQQSDNGSYYLLQAKNVSGDLLTHETEGLIRFDPKLSRIDQPLVRGDLLFMARGAHHFTIQVTDLPEPTLAAACFFVIRPHTTQVSSGYLCWYLNQVPVHQYLIQFSGRSVHMPVVRRAVLENIQIPLPSFEIQSKIEKLNEQLHKEFSLMQKLGDKRKELITAACMQAV